MYIYMFSTLLSFSLLTPGLIIFNLLVTNKRLNPKILNLDFQKLKVNFHVLVDNEIIIMKF